MTAINFKALIYPVLIFTISVVGYLSYQAIVNYKNLSVIEALRKKEASDNEVLLRQQAQVIRKHSEASAKIQKTQARSFAIKTDIEKSQATDGGAAIKDTMIDEINCRIENFLNYELCEK
jgi:hypothetical protein